MRGCPYVLPVHTSVALTLETPVAQIGGGQKQQIALDAPAAFSYKAEL
jgi:hypothetical protein